MLNLLDTKITVTVTGNDASRDFDTMDSAINDVNDYLNNRYDNRRDAADAAVGIKIIEQQGDDIVNLLAPCLDCPVYYTLDENDEETDRMEILWTYVIGTPDWVDQVDPYEVQLG